MNVKGQGEPNSGQLLFTITSLDEKTKIPLAVWMDTEAQVFTSMTTLLTMAYRAALPVQVQYQLIEAGTSRAIEVQIPPT